MVGPYQGTLGCLRIAFGRGVCGLAAAERRTVIVPDVDTFPGHIACDSRSKSEIVVPVLDAAGALLGVLDVDATELAAFDDNGRGLAGADIAAGVWGLTPPFTTRSSSANAGTHVSMANDLFRSPSKPRTSRPAPALWVPACAGKSGSKGKRAITPSPA